MLLSDLLRDLPGARVKGRTDAEIRGIVYDSRRSGEGSLFVAVKGESFDGHEFAAAAAKAGAVAVVAEREIEGLSNVSLVLVDESRAAMAALASRFYDYPSRKLKLIGVTGTKGKTTTTYLIASILNAVGQKTGVIGTIGSRIGSKFVESEHTTPDSVDLQALLARMVEADMQTVAMEVSSHGLAQGRVSGCEFDCGIFTNLTRDHLDYHSTMEEYLDAKLLLFTDYAAKSSKEFTAVVNVDDPASATVIQAVKIAGVSGVKSRNLGQVLTFGVSSQADITATNITASAKGVTYKLNYAGEQVEVDLKLGGLFNAYNSLAAAGAAISQGLTVSQVAEGLAQAETVAGRFESIECGQDFAVLVDYAHAPDALENVLTAARDLTESRLIVVFGCGGNRDRGKRPIMGRIASELADLCMVTSDNPRKEDPDAIIAEIMAGISNGSKDRVTVESDRRTAIEKSLTMAGPGDVVVIAGKGHEDCQIFADHTIHFDDREVAREILCGRLIK